MKYPDDTIMAPATYPGKSALCVIRLSGKDTFSVLEKIFTFKNPSKNFKNLKPYTISLGLIKNGKDTIDTCLLSCFRAPKSFTGENMAELSLHGGPYITKIVLGLLASAGCRHAEPGEFSRRAFLNSKIDLPAAEAAADIISAQNETALKISINQLSGRENSEIQKLKKSLLSVLSLIESEIEFSHEGIEGISLTEAKNKINPVLDSVDKLIETADRGIKLKEGFSLVIAGSPNTGKSSLLNRFLNKDRAIVTGEPGTTRDTLEEQITLGSLPFIITDTAGIRKSASGAEKLGMERSEQAISRADIIIFLTDGSSLPGENDLRAFLPVKEKKYILAVNKSDLPQVKSLSEFRKFFSVPENIPVLTVSALKNTGIEGLTKAIKNIIINSYGAPSADKIVVSNLRHKACLEKAKSCLISAISGGSFGHELMASDIREACSHLSSITGEIVSEEVLDEIFKNFCIGK